MAMTGRDVVSRVVRALEALEDGDLQFARALLESLLDERPRRPRWYCRHCGLRFVFPGELDEHVRVSHPGHFG
jgi:hypothetical protein